MNSILNGKTTKFDIHTHTVASGHGTTDTVTDLCRRASKIGLDAIGISDHAPAFPGAAKESYFRSLLKAPKNRFGIDVLYGVELNILNAAGDVDLPDELISSLDYAIISLHTKVVKPMSLEDNTNAYIKAMEHPNVCFIGHPDDSTYPVDYVRLLSEAKKRGVYPEINNASLMPKAYRKDCRSNNRTILSICKDLSLPVLLSSDSHGKEHIADFSYIYPLLKECDFPSGLIINPVSLSF